MLPRIKLLLTVVLTAIIFDLAAARIVCTTYPVWLLTRAIVQGTPGTDLTLLVNPAAGCAHDFTPSSGDLRQAARPGTILIANGAGLDDHIVQSLLKINSNLHLLQCANPAAEFDAHQFVSPDTALFMAKNIMLKLSEFDPDHSTIYRKNFYALQKQLNELTVRSRTIKPHTAVLQSPLFLNLAKTANCPTIVIKSSHSDILSANSLKKLLQRIRKSRPAILWSEKGSTDSAAAAIQKNIQLPVVQLDSMLDGPAEPPYDYPIKIMRANLDAIEKAVQQ